MAEDDTRAATPRGIEPSGDDDSAATEPPQQERTPSQRNLHAEVRGRLFEGKPPPRDFETGEVIAGRYRIVGLLGRGGMGDVFHAHDLVLGEDVAIKFLPHGRAGSEAFMRRFVNEVRLARQITHPAVCRVHDIGEVEGRRFLSMEFIDGEDLASLLRRIGRLPPEKAFELAQQLCAGLSELHEHEVLHRDLKPANLMIDGQGRLKLADFGLAAVPSELGDHELGDGTPAYMAPEQLRGEGVSHRSDIYALGLVLYELLTGRHPYEPGDTALGERRALDRSTAPVSLASRVPGLPSDATEIIEQCLHEDPERRPGSVLEIAASLPGGDPVAAALQAGRAPSVEALANVKRATTLPAWAAWTLAGLIGVIAVVFGALAPQHTLLGRSRSELSPAVLRDRARTLLDDAHLDAPHSDSFSRIFYDGAYLDAEAPPSTFEAGPTPVIFEYRQSPIPMVRRGEVVTRNDPAMEAPGEIRVRLDSRGSLREFETVPPHEMGRSVRAADVWDSFLAATGADLDTLVESRPRLTPPRAADTQLAWEVVLPGQESPCHVEAASWQGQPVWFVLLPPWESPRDRSQAVLEASTGITTANDILALAVFGGFVVGLALLCRYLYLRGEVDTRGAWRISVVLCLSVVLGQLLREDVGYGGSPIFTIFESAKEGLLIGGLGFLGYVVVEPFGRRYVPTVTVSWARITRGRWRDSLVGRDVLVGAAVGAEIALAVRAKLFVTGVQAPRVPSELGLLFDLSQTLGGVLDSFWLGAFGVMQVYVVFVFLRLILRSNGRAAAVFFLLWTFVEIARTASDGLSSLQWVAVLAAGFVIAGSLVFLILRVGILGLTAAQVVLNVLFSFPLTLEFDAWYASAGLLGFGALAAVVGFGLRVGLGHASPLAPRLATRTVSRR